MADRLGYHGSFGFWSACWGSHNPIKLPCMKPRRILRATALHRKGPFRAGSARHDPLPIRALDTVAVLYFLVPILDRSKYRVGLVIGYTLLILNLWWHLNGHGDFKLLRHGSLPQQGVDFILKHSRSLIHWFWVAIFESNDYFGRLCFDIFC